MVDVGVIAPDAIREAPRRRGTVSCLRRIRSTEDMTQAKATVVKLGGLKLGTPLLGHGDPPEVASLAVRGRGAG